MISHQQTIKDLANQFLDPSSSSEKQKKKALVAIEKHFDKHPNGLANTSIVNKNILIIILQGKSWLRS
jgi:hypothetical protein